MVKSNLDTLYSNSNLPKNNNKAFTAFQLLAESENMKLHISFFLKEF